MQPETKTEAGRYFITDYQLQKIFVQIAQITIYPLLLILRLVIVRNRLYRNKDILKLKKNDAKTTYVLYANHQSKLDPLIICAALPYKAIRELLPFRFFVENSYLRGPMKVFLNVMGGFPAHYKAGKPYGLDQARALMALKQTIVIFPPGMRTRKHIAKPGISVLATEPNTHLIPVHIDWKHRWHCHVHIGAPIKGDIAQPPEHFMRYAYKLTKGLNS